MADAVLAPQTSKDFPLKELVITIVALQVSFFLYAELPASLPGHLAV